MAGDRAESRPIDLSQCLGPSILCWPFRCLGTGRSAPGSWEQKDALHLPISSSSHTSPIQGIRDPEKCRDEHYYGILECPLAFIRSHNPNQQDPSCYCYEASSPYPEEALITVPAEPCSHGSLPLPLRKHSIALKAVSRRLLLHLRAQSHSTRLLLVPIYPNHIMFAQDSRYRSIEMIERSDTTNIQYSVANSQLVPARPASLPSPFWKYCARVRTILHSPLIFSPVGTKPHFR